MLDGERYSAVIRGERQTLAHHQSRLAHLPPILLRAPLAHPAVALHAPFHAGPPPARDAPARHATIQAEAALADQRRLLLTLGFVSRLQLRNDPHRFGRGDHAELGLKGLPQSVKGTQRFRVVADAAEELNEALHLRFAEWRKGQRALAPERRALQRTPRLVFG